MSKIDAWLDREGFDPNEALELRAILRGLDEQTVALSYESAEQRSEAPEKAPPAPASISGEE